MHFAYDMTRSLWEPGVECSDLDKNGPHRLIGLVIRKWHYLRRIRRYGLVEVGVALLEEVYHWSEF